MARVLITLVRTVIMLLAVQASGFPHFVADTFLSDDASEHASDSVPCKDDDDKSCPPGCPTCHVCGHVQALFVPRVVALVPESRDLESQPQIVIDARPPTPPAASFFRPPRA